MVWFVWHDSVFLLETGNTVLSFCLVELPSGIPVHWSAVSDSLQPHEPQHTRPPCPSPMAGVYPNPCPLSRWCSPTISSSVFFSSCPQSFPASGSFPMSHLYAWGDQVLEFQLQRQSFQWTPRTDLLWTPWTDLAVQGTLKSLPQSHSSKTSVLQHSAFFIVQLSHPNMTTGKTIALTRRTFVGKVMSLFFNMLSRLVIILLPRNKCLLISWLQSPSAVILEPPKIKSATVSTVSHLFPMKWWDWMPWS